MSEQRQEVREAVAQAWLTPHQRAAFECGFNIGAEWQARQTPRLWSCPACAFTFDAVHTEQDGSYSCPACAEKRLSEALEACAAALEDAGPCWDAGGSSRCYAHGGNDWPCPAAAAITQARAALDQEAQ